MIKKLFVVMVGLLVLPMVANATIYQLLNKGDTTDPPINGAIFTVPLLAYGGAGTGNIDAFVGIQGKGEYEQGYNTGGTLQYDTKGGTHTHPLSLAEIQTNIVDVSGTYYYEFLLDVNETAGNSVITLVDLEIYVLPSSGRTGYPFGTLPDFTLFPNQPATEAVPPATSPLPSSDWSTFDWDNTPYDGISIDYDNFPGSGGIIDMIALIPVDALTPYDSSLDSNPETKQYVYLYSVFGKPDVAIDDGFEEWARATEGTVTGGDVPPLIPEPGTLILLGSGLAGLAGYGKLRLRRKKK